MLDLKTESHLRNLSRDFTKMNFAHVSADDGVRERSRNRWETFFLRKFIRRLVRGYMIRAPENRSLLNSGMFHLYHWIQLVEEASESAQNSNMKKEVRIFL